MSSPSQHQLNLPPSLLTNSSHGTEPRTKDSQNEDVTAARAKDSQEAELRTICSRDTADAESAFLIDQALKSARISSKALSGVLGVSEPLINKWRSANYRECPSFVQLLQFPFRFHWHLLKLMLRRHGFLKLAMVESLEAQATVSFMVGE